MDISRGLGLENTPKLKIDPNTWGGYRSDLNTIFISDRLTKPSGPNPEDKTHLLQAMVVVTHELGHAWQTDIVKKLLNGELATNNPRYSQALMFLAADNYFRQTGNTNTLDNPRICS